MLLFDTNKSITKVVEDKTPVRDVTFSARLLLHCLNPEQDYALRL